MDIDTNCKQYQLAAVSRPGVNPEPTKKDELSRICITPHGTNLS